MVFSLPELLIATIALLVSLFLYYIKSTRSKNPLLPIDWPIVGVLPSFVANLRNFHDYLTVVLAASGGNFKAHGPRAINNTRFFITSDPANVRHIFTTNHANYPKGEEFAEIFDIVRGTILTDDGEACRKHRGEILIILSNPQMLSLMASCCQDKVVNGLLPFLARMASTTTPFDIQGLIARLAFDQIATPVFGVDPGCLSPDMPSMHAAAAMDTVMEVAFIRHVTSASFWKVMRRLSIGPERKLAAAHTRLHGFVTEMMEKRKARRVYLDEEQNKVASVDILSSVMTDPECSDELLRKKLIVSMIAGRDTVGTTLPWVFYNLANNPDVVSRIRKELAPIASRKGGAVVSKDTMVVFEPKETKSLVYLEATLFESLRLYPPVPFERKAVLADDVLPSGHEVHCGETILISIYAMGRMESVWGKDCHEYKPERWLSEDGAKLRHVPSHKFLAFNSGPRMCLGKDIAIMQMKTVVAAVVWNFDVEVLEGQRVEPKLSFLLQMKNGLMVMVNKREE
ncbi:noroxomaritidine synthase-like [Phragmites australis]|uniref:noroxomaritidine synthase-like n=1 Tax=Phragmites australis TaxID=29695 RepID=UPI002D77A94E|nr:noroxomaritidine synthase-like [Phragmites australis]